LSPPQSFFIHKEKNYQLTRAGDSNHFFLTIFDVDQRRLEFLENQYIIIIKQHIRATMDPPNHQPRIEAFLDDDFSFLDQIAPVPPPTLEAQIITFHKFLVLERINLLEEFIIGAASDPAQHILDQPDLFFPSVFQ
jgi:hypothetical protein